MYIQTTTALYDLHLKWYTEPIESETYANLNLHHAIDIDTLTLWKCMSAELSTFFQENPGINPAHDFRPYIVDLWNKAKGGQDVVSRQLCNSKIDFRRLSPRAFLLIRQIMTQMLNTHLLYRLVKFQLNENIDNVGTSWNWYMGIQSHWNRRE